eukprot:gene1654-1022_t
MEDDASLPLLPGALMHLVRVYAARWIDRGDGERRQGHGHGHGQPRRAHPHPHYDAVRAEADYSVGAPDCSACRGLRAFACTAAAVRGLLEWELPGDGLRLYPGVALRRYEFDPPRTDFIPAYAAAAPTVECCLGPDGLRAAAGLHPPGGPQHFATTSEMQQRSILHVTLTPPRQHSCGAPPDAAEAAHPASRCAWWVRRSLCDARLTLTLLGPRARKKATGPPAPPQKLQEYRPLTAEDVHALAGTGANSFPFAAVETLELVQLSFDPVAWMLLPALLRHGAAGGAGSALHRLVCECVAVNGFDAVLRRPPQPSPLQAAAAPWPALEVLFFYQCGSEALWVGLGQQLAAAAPQGDEAENKLPLPSAGVAALPVRVLHMEQCVVAPKRLRSLIQQLAARNSTCGVAAAVDGGSADGMPCGAAGGYAANAGASLFEVHFIFQNSLGSVLLEALAAHPALTSALYRLDIPHCGAEKADAFVQFLRSAVTGTVAVMEKEERPIATAPQPQRLFTYLNLRWNRGVDDRFYIACRRHESRSRPHRCENIPVKSGAGCGAANRPLDIIFDSSLSLSLFLYSCNAFILFMISNYIDICCRLSAPGPGHSLPAPRVAHRVAPCHATCARPRRVPLAFDRRKWMNRFGFSACRLIGAEGPPDLFCFPFALLSYDRMEMGVRLKYMFLFVVVVVVVVFFFFSFLIDRMMSSAHHLSLSTTIVHMHRYARLCNGALGRRLVAPALLAASPLRLACRFQHHSDHNGIPSGVPPELRAPAPPGGAAARPPPPAPQAGATEGAEDFTPPQKPSEPPKFLTISQNDKGIYTVCFARPPVNSLHLELLQEFNQWMLWLGSTEEIKGIILSSAIPTVFSAGLDLQELHRPQPERLTAFWNAFQETWIILNSFPKPIIAAITGNSPSAGCTIAMGCDYRVMARGPRAPAGGGAVPPNRLFRIGLNECKLGLVAPAWVMPAYAYILGSRQAERMLQLGETPTADDALKLGLVDLVVESEEKVMEAAMRAAERFVAIPQPSRWMARDMMRREYLQVLASEDDRGYDTEFVAQLISSPEVQGSLEAYLERFKNMTRK